MNSISCLRVTYMLSFSETFILKLSAHYLTGYFGLSVRIVRFINFRYRLFTGYLSLFLTTHCFRSEANQNSINPPPSQILMP